MNYPRCSFRKAWQLGGLACGGHSPPWSHGRRIGRFRVSPVCWALRATPSPVLVTTFHLNAAAIPRSRHCPCFTKKETAGNPRAKEAHSVRIKKKITIAPLQQTKFLAWRKTNQSPVFNNDPNSSLSQTHARLNARGGIAESGVSDREQGDLGASLLLQGLDSCICQTSPSESMVCYVLMIYPADGELEVLRASGQMGRRMLAGRPPSNSLFMLLARNFPTDSSTVSYVPMGMKYVFFFFPKSLFRAESLHTPFWDCRVLSKFKVNKYCKMWARNESQKGDWGRREVASLGPFPIWPQRFDYFMNA
ncbi:hypothetical protein HJG60_008071 [Phyllostomus discolor]|uniref:Uncharacterized protein n=1 Tax=Phyllostomus discolor TaxID=89673 RepID=A0A834EVI3_9CHIR|nr:hypothetical protein HJG60_008071 [Phyllostomus discolor]